MTIISWSWKFPLKRTERTSLFAGPITISCHKKKIVVTKHKVKIYVSNENICDIFFFIKSRKSIPVKETHFLNRNKQKRTNTRYMNISLSMSGIQLLSTMHTPMHSLQEQKITNSCQQNVKSGITREIMKQIFFLSKL